MGSRVEPSAGFDGTLPAGLGWMRQVPAGRAWLAELPRLVAECAQRWSLRLGPPFPYAMVSLALPAYRPDGTAAVLKLQYPGPDSRHEAAALAAWDGTGAVRLLAYDADRRALLVERCEPGGPLHRLPLEEALDVTAGLLPRLWRPARPEAVTPIRSLAEEATGWLAQLPVEWERAGRPYERRLLDVACDRLAGLVGTQGEQVLVNQDLHAGNVLAATREPWLVIDPKPLVGEREFSVVPMIRGPELGHGPALLRRRLDRLTADLGLDRERVLGWTIGQTLAWSTGPDLVIPTHLEVVRWLVEQR
ncbi:aminoglycoside phosphotransferase [Micromonospora rosaria]|uniref:Aminoglycoside phosphotransferase n=1 Tax=Micromonospora rosaria TaxID=47874 RepID=A0A136PXU6_9ACTN|nr:aminoglycoside phosphotransferase family protein [Micromonospora rosaria]KXK63084.1 aminoglycoside phosphotransferase [Micromonospora rosaria]